MKMMDLILANGENFAKFAKINSLKNFPLYGIPSIALSLHVIWQNLIGIYFISLRSGLVDLFLAAYTIIITVNVYILYMQLQCWHYI